MKTRIAQLLKLIFPPLVLESLQEGFLAFQVRPWPIMMMMLGLTVFFAIFQFGSSGWFGEKSWQTGFVSLAIQILFMIFYPGLQAYSFRAVQIVKMQKLEGAPRQQDGSGGASCDTQESAVPVVGPSWRDFLWGWKYPVRIFAADVLSTLPIILWVLVLGLAMVFVNSWAVLDSHLWLKYLILGFLATSSVFGVAVISLGLNQWNLVLIDQDFKQVGSVSAFQSVLQSWTLMKGHKGSFLLLMILVLTINCLGALALLVGLLVSIPLSLGAFAAFYLRISKA